MAHRTLFLRTLDRDISIRCDDAAVYRLLRRNYEAMCAPAPSPGPAADRAPATGRAPATRDVRYEVLRAAHGFTVYRGDAGVIAAATDLGSLLYEVDSDLVVQLQRLRQDLLFLHAAVLTDPSGAHLLVGRSGAGKSTTCWGLLHHGFGYLSDELAPIRPGDLVVHPFPRALCLKTPPPRGYELDPGTATPGRGHHVAVARLPSGPGEAGARIRTLLFVEYAATRERPLVRAIGPAEAAARLYPNVLNALSQPDAALSAITRVACSARAFVVDAAELSATCEAIGAVVADSGHDGSPRPSDAEPAVRKMSMLPTSRSVAPTSSSPSSAATSTA